ncbi:MAG: hypothetical protein ABIK09_00080 [Pseudomonadota bacterium]
MMRFVGAVAVLLVTGPAVAADWYVEETPHFRFETHQGNARALRPLVERAEEIRDHHCQLIEPCFEQTITVQVLPESESFRKAQPGAHIDWAAGIAYFERDLILLRLDEGMMLTLLETFEHEVSHIALLSAVPRRPPQWFIEGLAILQARQDLISRFEAAAGAALHGNLIPFKDLEEGFPSSASGRRLAYAQSGLFLYYVQAEVGGPEGLRKVISRLVAGDSIDRAVHLASGKSLDDIEAGWRDTFAGVNSWIISLRDSWWVWTGMAFLFLLAVFVKTRRIRKRKRQMVEEESEWEYRRPSGPTVH